MPNPTIVEAGNSRAHPVCDALQQRVHQLSFLIFPVFCLVKAGELHPARNPRIGAGIDKECGDRQRTLIGDVAKRRVANALFLVRVHIGTCAQEHSHDVEVPVPGGIVQRRPGEQIERIRRWPSASSCRTRVMSPSCAAKCKSDSSNSSSNPSGS
jgi:hypothetical protein